MSVQRRLIGMDSNDKTRNQSRFFPPMLAVLLASMGSLFFPFFLLVTHASKTDFQRVD